MKNVQGTRRKVLFLVALIGIGIILGSVVLYAINSKEETGSWELELENGKIVLDAKDRIELKEKALDVALEDEEIKTLIAGKDYTTQVTLTGNVTVEDIIEDAIHSNEHKITAGDIGVVRQFDHDLPKIKCGNLYQVFCNLIKNSIDAIVDRGTLTIITKRSNDEWALIEFRDTGPGIDAENIESIFEPFFTTKRHGKGTGLGLAICKDIIEKYDGRITACNNPGGGSCFSVYLPLKNKNLSQEVQE